MTKHYNDPYPTSIQMAKSPAGLTELRKYYRKFIKWYGRTYQMAPDTLEALYPSDFNEDNFPASYHGIAINYRGWHYDVVVKSNEDCTAPTDKVIKMQRRTDLDHWREDEVELRSLNIEKLAEFFKEQ